MKTFKTNKVNKIVSTAMILSFIFSSLPFSNVFAAEPLKSGPVHINSKPAEIDPAVVKGNIQQAMAAEDEKYQKIKEQLDAITQDFVTAKVKEAQDADAALINHIGRLAEKDQSLALGDPENAKKLKSSRDNKTTFAQLQTYLKTLTQKVLTKFVNDEEQAIVTFYQKTIKFLVAELKYCGTHKENLMKLLDKFNQKGANAKLIDGLFKAEETKYKNATTAFDKTKPQLTKSPTMKKLENTEEDLVFFMNHLKNQGLVQSLSDIQTEIDNVKKDIEKLKTELVQKSEEANNQIADMKKQREDEDKNLEQRMGFLPSDDGLRTDYNDFLTTRDASRKEFDQTYVRYVTGPVKLHIEDKQKYLSDLQSYLADLSVNPNPGPPPVYHPRELQLKLPPDPLKTVQDLAAKVKDRLDALYPPITVGNPEITHNNGRVNSLSYLFKISGVHSSDITSAALFVHPEGSDQGNTYNVLGNLRTSPAGDLQINGSLMGLTSGNYVMELVLNKGKWNEKKITADFKV